MKSVFVIVRVGRQVTGHGESELQTQIPRSGPYDTGEYHPAFDTRENALRYIRSIPYAYDLQPIELKPQQ